MNAFGWNRSPFTPLSGGVRLAQSVDQADWNRRAQAATAEYGSLLARTGQIADQGARDAVKAWLGRSDLPGDPAERYKAVMDALSSKGPWTTISTKRVEDLEDAVREFGLRVSDAEKTYGTLNAGTAPVPTASPTGALTPTGFALAAVAVLALVVVPFVID